MIDLHLQSSLGNGTTSLYKILEKVSENNLSYFSIVDLNHAFAYNLIEEDKYPQLITGTKMACLYQGRAIVLIAYDIDPKIINDFYNDAYSIDNIINIEKNLSSKILSVLEKAGYILTDLNLRYEKLNSTVKQIHQQLLIQYPDFPYQKSRDFRIYGINNPDSKFFIDQSDNLYDVDEAINILKSAGGKIFLAHPFEYRTDVSKLLEMVIEKNLDGVEVFHSSASVLNSLKLIEFCEGFNKLASVGSGFMGEDDYIPMGVFVDPTIYNYKCFSWIFER